MEYSDKYYLEILSQEAKSQNLLFNQTFDKNAETPCIAWYFVENI
jgi:hypothetical protein